MDKALQNTEFPNDNDPKRITPAPAESLAKPQKSIGEKVFHFTTYTGVGYIANLMLSLAIWDFFLTGKGKPHLESIGKGVGNILKAGGMAEASAMKTGKTMADMAFATMGGHLTMIPVKLGEDHARYCCHVANKAFDPNYKYRDLKATLSTPEHDLPPMVDEPSDHTWGQIAIRRGLAMAAVTASGTALNKFQGGKYQDLLEKTTIRYANKGIELSGIPALQKFGQLPVTQRYLKLAALDSYFTVITSTVVAMTKNMFGKELTHAEAADAAYAQLHPEENKAWQGVVRNKPPASHAESINQQPPAPSLAV